MNNLDTVNILSIDIQRSNNMDIKETRKKQFTDLFALHGAEVDLKLLSENYYEISDYEWNGFLHSINLIIRMKNRPKNKPVQ